jgi:glycosyltransferase involved in cell wall biosynthesis
VTRASVVVPSRGGADRLPGLVEALRAQTHPDWEAVIVLDGDVDGSAEVLDRLTADLPVRVVVLPDNRGRSAALNAGFAAATGEVLLRCDDDLAPGPQHVARHVAHHERAEGPVGVIGLCPNVYPHPTAYSRVYGAPRDRLLRDAAYSAGAGDAWRSWAANVSVTGQTWQRIGPYDTRLRAYGWEDVDWGYRLHRAGVPIRIERELEAAHLGAAATSGSRALRAYYSGAARHAFVALHADDPALAVALPAPTPGAGAWGAAVGALARVASERTVPRVGRVIDAVLPGIPSRWGEKLVSVLVEGAGVAGYRAGRTTGRI